MYTVYMPKRLTLSVHPNILRLARTLREGRAMLMVEVVQFLWSHEFTTGNIR